jgi:ABC-type branched-subunit amino acid transport system permease subunit
MAQGHAKSADKNLIDLAFGMVTYTYGPLLGVLLAAILPGKKSLRGIILGTVVSILVVAWVRPELPRLLESMGLATQWLADTRPQIAFPWFYPINALLTLGCAYLPLGRTTRATEHEE